MEIFRDRSEQYLQRTKESSEKKSTLSPEEWSESAIEITKNLTEESWEEEGRMVFVLPRKDNEPPATCTIDYGLDVPNSSDSSPDSMDLFSSKTHRRINNIVIDNGKKKIDFAELSVGLPMIVSRECYDDPNKQLENLRGGVSYAFGFVETNADPRSVFGIFVLLHELGHVKIANERLLNKSRQAQESRDKLNRRDGLTPKDSSAIIKEERTASAIALNNLKDFLDSDMMGKLKKLVVHKGLKTYHDAVVSCMEPPAGKKPSWFSSLIEKLKR